MVHVLVGRPMLKSNQVCFQNTSSVLPLTCAQRNGHPHRRRQERVDMPKAYTKNYRRLLKHIRSRRVALGLSEDQVAARVGQSLLWIQRVEAGKHRMDFLEAVDLLRALDIDLEDAARIIQDKPR